MLSTPKTDDFATDHLTGPAKAFADALNAALMALKGGRAPWGGGCPAYRTREQWIAKGEEYGTEPNVVLILLHDGGDLSRYSGEPGAWNVVERIAKEHWMYLCSETGWYTSVRTNEKE